MTRAGAVVAVVAPPYLPYAPAWQAAGVDLRYIEIIDADARNALWAFEQCLRSAACGAVLGWPLHADAQALDRKSGESGKSVSGRVDLGGSRLIKKNIKYNNNKGRT